MIPVQNILVTDRGLTHLQQDTTRIYQHHYVYSKMIDNVWWDNSSYMDGRNDLCITVVFNIKWKQTTPSK
jgi:hypothetical protein